MANIKKFQEYINENYSSSHDEYAGEHEAPKAGDATAPLYDLTVMYPNDIYSSDALRLYGQNEDKSVDIECLNVIHGARNKPNKLVKIYRAIPDLNKETKKKISDLSDLLIYKERFGFFPIRKKSPLMGEIDDKFDIEEFPNYDEKQKAIVDYINSLIDELTPALSKYPTIHKGDWVTISKTYAKEHGISNLNGKYKIISKTVRAKDLFTHCDDLAEWGYDPQEN